ncbi:Hypothetical_protein [Hexamita inflata]|uniref:Hypothetical_protein n=1 Tax=Hexamita inflata TaxID=28002 RepID=A0AA86PR86_9EUKA|nr:Hypothetical protein HINF_LOCUS32495 [Hexamita inflata]
MSLSSNSDLANIQLQNLRKLRFERTQFSSAFLVLNFCLQQFFLQFHQFCVVFLLSLDNDLEIVSRLAGFAAIQFQRFDIWNVNERYIFYQAILKFNISQVDPVKLVEKQFKQFQTF